MDNFFRQKESDIRSERSPLASLNIFGGFLRWLGVLLQFTKEEQDDAGIYIGNSYSNDEEKTK